MATYLSKYKHDVFVSYAHVNNEKYLNVDKGWVSRLVEYLKVEVTQRLGKFGPWMDYKLPPNEKFPKEIFDAIEQSGTLLIILSPAYVRSNWCCREREKFLEMVKGKGPGRVFIVEYYPVSDSEKPVELGELSPICFWVEDGEQKTPWSMGFPELLPIHKERYYKNLNDLAHYLTRTLKDIEERELLYQDSSSITSKPELFRPAVFLAETTDDLRDKWLEIKNYLDQQNFEILPKISIYDHYLTDPSTAEQMLDTNLEKCRVFVQLLSGISGRKIPGQEISISRLQYNRAEKLNKKILQWCDDPILQNLNNINDNDQRDLVERICSKNFESFKRDVVKKVKALKNLPLGTYVFLDTDNTDRNLGKNVGEIIKKDIGIGYCLPPEADEEERVQVIEDRKNSVECCDGLMVFHGKANYFWVRQEFLTLGPILQSVRKIPKVIAFYKGPPPENKRDLGIELPKMITIDSSIDHNIERERLRPFLEGLTEGENL